MAYAVRLLRAFSYRLNNNLISKVNPSVISASYSVCRGTLKNLNKTQSSALLCNHINSSEVVSQKRYITDDDKKLTLQEIQEKVLNVIKTFDKLQDIKTNVTLDSHFMTDLSLDSLDHVELIMNIEDEFNMEVPDSDAEKLLHPKDIVEYVLRKQQADTSAFTI